MIRFSIRKGVLMKNFLKSTKRFFSRPIVLAIGLYLSASYTPAQSVVTRIDPNYYVGRSHQYVVTML